MIMCFPTYPHTVFMHTSQCRSVHFCSALCMIYHPWFVHELCISAHSERAMYNVPVLHYVLESEVTIGASVCNIAVEDGCCSS